MLRRQFVAVLLLLILGCVGHISAGNAKKSELRSRYPLRECGSDIEGCIAVLSSHIEALRQVATQKQHQEAVLSSGRLPYSVRAQGGSFSRVALWSHQLGHYCGKVKLIAAQLLADLHPIREPIIDVFAKADGEDSEVGQDSVATSDVSPLRDTLDDDDTVGAKEEEKDFVVVDDSIDGEVGVKYGNDEAASTLGDTADRSLGAGIRRVGKENVLGQNSLDGGITSNGHTVPKLHDSQGAWSLGEDSNAAGSSCSHDVAYASRDIFITKLELLQWIMFLVNEIEEGSAETPHHLEELETACPNLLALYQEEPDLFNPSGTPQGSARAGFGAYELSNEIGHKVAQFTEAVRAAAKNAGIDVEVVADAQYFTLGSDGRLHPISDKPQSKEEEVHRVVQELAHAEARVERQQQNRNFRAAETTPSNDEKLVDQLTKKLLDMWESEEYNKYIQVYSLSTDQTNNITASTRM